MTHVTCRLNAKNRDRLQNPTSVIEYGLPLPLLDSCMSDEPYWAGLHVNTTWRIRPFKNYSGHLFTPRMLPMFSAETAEAGPERRAVLSHLDARRLPAGEGTLTPGRPTLTCWRWYSHTWTPDAYLLARAYVAGDNEQPSCISETFPPEPTAGRPRVPLTHATKKV